MGNFGNRWAGLTAILGIGLAPGCGGDDGTSATPLSTTGADDAPDDDASADDDDDDDDDDDTGEGGGEETDAGNGEEGPDDSGTDPPPAGGCDLDMEVAIHLAVDVGWGGGLAVLEGTGTIDVWLLGALEPDGNDVHLTGQLCRLSLPDFQTGALAGGEKYGTLFPDAIWAAPAMPAVDAWVTVSSLDTGASLVLPEGAVVLGANLADPINDPWPSEWGSLMSADHDGDSNAGITSVAKTGDGYAYPRIDILNSEARAEALFIASRTVMSFDGVIDTCDSASGSASMVMENHALGCRILGGGSCSSGQTGTLDGNLPVFEPQGGTFELKRLPDGANCQDVFAATP